MLVKEQQCSETATGMPQSSNVIKLYAERVGDPSGLCHAVPDHVSTSKGAVHVLTAKSILIGVPSPFVMALNVTRVGWRQVYVGLPTSGAAPPPTASDTADAAKDKALNLKDQASVRAAPPLPNSPSPLLPVLVCRCTAMNSASGV